MVELYAALVINGRRPFDKIPKKFQEAVAEALKEQGYGTDGKPLAD